MIDEPVATAVSATIRYSYCPAFGCTFGEATIEQKMQVSHRGRALDAMFTYLRSIAST